MAAWKHRHVSHLSTQQSHFLLHRRRLGGDQLEVIQGDAYYQSYICRIPRSTLELGLTGRLDCLDLLEALPR